MPFAHVTIAEAIQRNERMVASRRDPTDDGPSMRIGLSTSVIQRGETGIGQYLFALVRAMLFNDRLGREPTPRRGRNTESV